MAANPQISAGITLSQALEQVRADSDFMGAPLAQQKEYLRNFVVPNVDADFKAATPQEQNQYLDQFVLPALSEPQQAQPQAQAQPEGPEDLGLLPTIFNKGIETATLGLVDRPESSNQLGNIIGGLGGSIIPVGIGTLVGGLPGSVAAATALGAGTDIREQLNEGATPENLNLGRTAINTVGSGLGQFLGGKLGTTLLRDVGLNAGINALTDAGAQLTDNQPFDLARVAGSAALGAGGSVAGRVAPKLARGLTRRQQNRPVGVRGIEALPQPEATQGAPLEDSLGAQRQKLNEALGQGRPDLILESLKKVRSSVARKARRAETPELQEQANQLLDAMDLIESDVKAAKQRGQTRFTPGQKQVQAQVVAQDGQPIRVRRVRGGRIDAEPSEVGRLRQQRKQAEALPNDRLAQKRLRSTQKGLEGQVETTKGVKQVAANKELTRTQRSLDSKNAAVRQQKKAEKIVIKENTAKILQGKVKSQDIGSIEEDLKRLQEIGPRKRTGEAAEIKSRLSNVDESLKDVLKAEPDFDKGIAKQSPIDNRAKTYDQIKNKVGKPHRPKAEAINDAMKEGKRLPIRYVAEKVGSRGRGVEVQKGLKGGIQQTQIVAEEGLFSPTHWSETKAGQVLLHGYNKDGHFRTYHLDEGYKNGLLEGSADTVRSQITEVGRATDGAFKGPVANVYKGPGDFPIEPYLARIADEGIALKTSETAELAKELQKVSGGLEVTRVSPRMAQILAKAIGDPELLNKTELKSKAGLRKFLSSEEKVLKKVCDSLGF